MAKLDGRQGSDKKRNGGNFKPQGKKGKGKSSGKALGVHRNKYAQFSKADSAQANLAARREQDARIAAREAEERRYGYRSYR
ncbi:MAG: hypothetical protein AAB790_03535 [Patescibacteria group bacterium]